MYSHSYKQRRHNNCTTPLH